MEKWVHQGAREVIIEVEKFIFEHNNTSSAEKTNDWPYDRLFVKIRFWSQCASSCIFSGHLHHLFCITHPCLVYSPAFGIITDAPPSMGFYQDIYANFSTPQKSRTTGTIRSYFKSRKEGKKRIMLISVRNLQSEVV